MLKLLLKLVCLQMYLLKNLGSKILRTGVPSAEKVHTANLNYAKLC